MSKLLKAVQTIGETIPPPVGDDAIYFNADNLNGLYLESIGSPSPRDKFLVSVWFRIDDLSATSHIINNLRVTLTLETSGALIFEVRKTSSEVLYSVTINSVLSSAKWHHLLVSNSSSQANLYLDDVAYSPDVWTTGDVDVQVFWGIGRKGQVATEHFTGGIHSTWLSIGQGLDFLIEANRRKFSEFNTEGQLVPVDLGDNGELPTGSSPVIYLPLNDLNAIGVNKGTGGDFTENGAFSLASTSPDTPSVEAVDFDGIGLTGTYLQNPTNFAANGSRITISCWFKLINDEVAQTNTIYTSGGANQIWLRFGSLNILRFSAKNTNGDIIQEFSISTEHLPQDVWNHILISIETGIPAQHVYLNDEIPVLGDVTNSTGLINQSSENIVIGSANSLSAGWLRGSLSELFMDRTYLDLSIESNRRLFINADLTPANTRQLHLTPQAENVRLYLPNPSANIEQNLGAVGNFTRNGILNNSLSTPLYDGVPTKEIP